MIKVKTFLKKYKNDLKIVIFFLFLGFLIGFLLIKKLDCQELLKEIKNIEIYLNTQKINYILFHLMVISLLATSSLTLIGLLLFPLYFIYEGACISFNIASFTSVFKLKGLIFSIFYNLITKAVFLVLLIFIFHTGMKIVKTKMQKETKEEEKKIVLQKKKKQMVFYILLLLVNDILIYFFANKILYALLFIIN